jgi:acyl carrier protein
LEEKTQKYLNKMEDDRFKDALYMLRVLMAVENEFDIIIQYTEVEFINTFEDLIKLIQEKENDINKRVV